MLVAWEPKWQTLMIWKSKYFKLILSRINECEALIKFKLEKLQELVRENEYLKASKNKDEQQKNEIWLDGDYDVQKSQISNEFREVKGQWREAYYSKIEKQKNVLAHHRKVVDLSKKCRKMYSLISEYSKMSEKERQELKMNSNDNVISQEVIDKMEQDIKLANERMK